MAFEWAANHEKLQRAIDRLNKAGKKYSEKDVKELYISFAGKVLEVVKPTKARSKGKK